LLSTRCYKSIDAIGCYCWPQNERSFPIALKKSVIKQLDLFLSTILVGAGIRVRIPFAAIFANIYTELITACGFPSSVFSMLLNSLANFTEFVCFSAV